jgi:ATP synthase protein I
METEKDRITMDHSEVGRIQKRICSQAMTSALVVALIFLFIQEKDIAKGLLLGTCFSILNFFLLGKSIPLTLGKSRSKAGFIGFTSLLTRYIILAIPLIVAVKSASFNFAAVAIGIFAVQIVTLVDYIVVRPILDRR